MTRPPIQDIWGHSVHIHCSPASESIFIARDSPDREVMIFNRSQIPALKAAIDHAFIEAGFANSPEIPESLKGFDNGN